MLDVQIHKPLLVDIKPEHIWRILQRIIDQIRILICEVAIIGPEVVACEVESTKNG